MSVATRWQGFWEQAGWGRQPMRQVVLRFEANQIDGEGIDIIGPFTLQGQIEQLGSVSLIKQYVGQHHVLYHGNYDGEGTIFGDWSINGFVGGKFVFHRDREHAESDSASALELADLQSG